MLNFGVWQLPDTPFGNAPGGRVPPESRPTSPKSRYVCHGSHLYKTVSEVFDLKPTSIRIWFRGRFDDIDQERSDDPKASEHRRTTQRGRRSSPRILACVLECGGAPPLFVAA